MKISDETAETLFRFGKEVKEQAKWAAPKVGVGLAVYFGAAAVLGWIGTALQHEKHVDQERALRDMQYIPSDKDHICVVADPEKEALVTVTGQHNNRFTQVFRAFAPFIAMTEGERVTLGKTPAYETAPCSVVKDGVVKYESRLFANAAEEANSKAMLRALEQARKDFTRTEALTFTTQPKTPQP